jgi:hypothetical protein
LAAENESAWNYLRALLALVEPERKSAWKSQCEAVCAEVTDMCKKNERPWEATQAYAFLLDQYENDASKTSVCLQVSTLFSFIHHFSFSGSSATI